MQSLTCLANWDSDHGPSSFLVGILDVPLVHKLTDKLRCFVYRQNKAGGYRVAQSRDASCHGLKNPKTDGFRIMHLKPGTPRYLIQATISNNCVTAFNTKEGSLGSKHNSNPPFKGHGDSESAIKSDLFKGL